MVNLSKFNWSLSEASLKLNFGKILIRLIYKGKPMITKQEALDLLKDKGRNIGGDTYIILLTDVYEVIDKIFDKSTIKDSFNNNSNCVIKI